MVLRPSPEQCESEARTALRHTLSVGRPIQASIEHLEGMGLPVCVECGLAAPESREVLALCGVCDSAPIVTAAHEVFSPEALDAIRKRQVEREVAEFEATVVAASANTLPTR